MTYELKTTDAYSALLNRIESKEPVVATFRMADVRGAVMEIEVDGVRQAFFLTINRDGTWAAMHKGDI